MFAVFIVFLRYPPQIKLGKSKPFAVRSKSRKLSPGIRRRITVPGLCGAMARRLSHGKAATFFFRLSRPARVFHCSVIHAGSCGVVRWKAGSWHRPRRNIGSVSHVPWRCFMEGLFFCRSILPPSLPARNTGLAGRSCSSSTRQIRLHRQKHISRRGPKGPISPTIPTGDLRRMEPTASFCF